MARKTINRKEERLSESQEEELKKQQKEAKAAKKAPAKRKSRAKVVKEVRLKASWGVFNQSLKRVALFGYSERAQADQKAQEMSESQKTPHFVQLVKEPVAE